MGGKFYEMKWVIPLMPLHEWYGEVFFGSGVLLLNKPKAEEEFANDLFSCLVSFWNTLKSAWLTRRLWKKMTETLDSRYDYQRYMRMNPDDLSMLDRAYRFLFLVKFGFNSYMNTYYSPASHEIGKIKDFMQTWLNTGKELNTYHNRIKKVHFSNYDFRDFLKKIRPHSKKFLFLDPPYINTHSYDEYYEEGGFDHNLYEDMRDLLAEHHKGGTMWQITCNQTNTYFDEMDDIIIKLVDRRACINKNEERQDVKTKIIMNYDVKETGSVLDLLDKEKQGDVLLV
jgi:DNA adenine methylase